MNAQKNGKVASFGKTYFNLYKIPTERATLISTILI